MEYQPQKLTDRELLEIFPEARKIIPLKIKECRVSIRKKEREIADLLGRLYLLKADSFSEWFGEELVKGFIFPDLMELEKNLFRLKHFEYLLNPEKRNDRQFEFKEKIEIARKYPIEELARSKLEKTMSSTLLN